MTESAAAREPVQGVLFPEDSPRLVVESVSPRQRWSAREVGSAAPLQRGLFDACVQLRSALEHAVRFGAFAEAARLRRTLVDEHGAAEAPTDLDFIEVLATLEWEPPNLASVLGTWQVLRGSVASPARRREVGDALLARLAASFSPQEIVDAGPEVLGDLAGLLTRSGSVEVARSLVRDALLRGRELDPTAFEDPRTRDVLAEDMEPRWLACVGALRHAWTVPKPDADELATVARGLDAPLPDSDAARALEFWNCMRVAGLRPRPPDAVLHAARVRMKQLHAELHGMFMRRLC